MYCVKGRSEQRLKGKQLVFTILSKNHDFSDSINIKKFFQIKSGLIRFKNFLVGTRVMGLRHWEVAYISSENLVERVIQGSGLTKTPLVRKTIRIILQNTTFESVEQVCKPEK